MRRSLDGKVAVITGGGEGIGLAAARLIAEEGATVYIIGRRQAVLDAAVADAGGTLIALQADVSSAADLARAYDTVRAAHGKIDILFANAGVQTKEALGSITEAALDYQLGINFKGVIYTVQEALPLLSNRASIILSSSVTAVKGLPERTVYSATKAAIRSFARTWVTELKDRRIRVNVLSPGPVMTPLVKASFVDEKAEQTYHRLVGGGVPMGRVGEPEEMGHVVAFLASDRSSFLNGADIQADGGFAQI